MFTIAITLVIVGYTTLIDNMTSPNGSTIITIFSALTILAGMFMCTVTEAKIAARIEIIEKREEK